MFVAAIIVAGICGYVQAQTQLGGGEAFTALRFNGGAFVRVPPSASIAATPEFSFEAWIKVPEGDTGNDAGLLRPIVSRFRKSSVNDTNNDFFLGLEPRGKVVAWSGSDDNEHGFLLRSNIVLQANTWYHIALSFKYADINNPFPYQANLYVDTYPAGVLSRDAVSAYWYGPGLTKTPFLGESFTIGKYANAAQDHYFKGTIDEVRIWQGKRSGDDIKNFAYRTVRDPTKDTWALTPEQGGTSSNKLVLSYNFNAAPFIFDQSGHENDGTLVIDTPEGTTNPPDFVPNDNKPIITFVYAAGSVPEAIQLLGVDFNDVDAIGLNFEITFDNLLNGLLFQRHPKNGEGVNPFPVPTTNVEVTPGIGAQISSGSVIAASQIVFIHDPSKVKNGKFHYRVTNGAGDYSLEVEVRIIVSCLEAGDQIDVCGHCNGNGAALDVCGVCNGDGTQCVGCDGVVNSGKLYDACGVCDGDGLSCIGCDGIVNSGKVYDDCGVCGGNNDTCWGCDGAVGVYDICGVCNGNNDTCDGCDGVPASGLVYDECGVCDGDGSSCWGCDHVPNSGLTYDICGECGGFNDSCRGCDGVPNSGIVLDNCGVCGGNGSTCAGCDGSGGGVVDACGVCRGDNSTCGGCDLKGGVIDACGVCAGDNSTCTCVAYHGYHVQELDYVLLQWGLTHSIGDIDKALKYLDDSLGLLTDYRGDLDLASVVIYLQEFLSNTALYEKTVLEFKRELDISLGNIYVPN